MKKTFENILLATKTLSEKQQAFIIEQLKIINTELVILHNRLDLKLRKDTLTPTSEALNETIIKAIEILKIYGFNEYTFVGLSPNFLEWFIDNTVNNPKFQPKLMNWYYLTAMHQSYMITYAIEQGNKPNFLEVKKNMVNFNEIIEEYEKESKLLFTDLIAKIDGEN
jgi:hypothetical protein